MIRPIARILAGSFAICGASVPAWTQPVPDFSTILYDHGAAGRATRTLWQRRGPRWAPAVAPVQDVRLALSRDAATRTTRATFDTTGGLVIVEASRERRSAKDGFYPIGLGRDRSARWSIAAGYQLPLGQDDDIRLVATLGGEKQRPAIPVAGGHRAGTMAATALVGWRRAGGLRFDAGWFDLAPSRRLPPLERAVVLARGSSIAERGYQLAVSSPLEAAAALPARIGLRLASATIAPGEQRAIGAPEHRDLRAALFVGLRIP